jgi:hypothetical protein
MATRKKTTRTPARKKAPAKPAKKVAKKASAKKAPAKKAARKAPARKAAAKKAGRRAPMGPSARSRGMTVEAYIAGFNDWRGETVSALRQLIREAAPDATESIKWGQPVYELNGPFAHIKAFRSHVNFGFWRGAELVDPKGFLKGTGARMRHVELRSLADIDAPILQSMVRTAVALNHAKGDPTQRR